MVGPTKHARWLLLALAIACPGAVAGNEFEQERNALEGIRTALGMKAADLVFADGLDATDAPSSQPQCTGQPADRDLDRLDDCVETATGRFVSPASTGTFPDNPDTDGDGLLDGDEVLGTAAGLDLRALGTHPLRKDVLLEYDWFDSSATCGFPTHRPTAGAIAEVARLFANAPVRNPDGTTGINVVQDYGQGGAFSGGNALSGWSARLPGTFDATHAAIKAANFDARRLGYFHYVLMAYSYQGGTSSGYAETIGDDMLVTLQCSRSDSITAATIAHELGHNLGLRHGGGDRCNGKPNYASIMNYRYTFTGVEPTCGSGTPVADFSRGVRIELDEAALDETRGTCGSAPVDWNADGRIETGLAYDLNPQYASACGGALTKLSDFDDWSALTYAGLLDKHGLLEGIQSEVGCPPIPTGGVS